MKSFLLDHLQCPACQGEVGYDPGKKEFFCKSCGLVIPAHDEKPLFTTPPGEMVPYDKIVRGRDIGTPWRQANWRFLEAQLGQLKPDAVILDIGTGRGEFEEIFAGRRCLALDVYPYPEVDVVCDLTQAMALRPGSFDAITVMNVLEHILDTHAILEALGSLLKPGGVMIVAIPFMVKIHQAPVDFVRYTHFALQRLGEEHGLEMQLLEGYYDPQFLLDLGIGNIRNTVLPSISGVRHYLGRLLLAGVQACAGALPAVLGSGRAQPPADTRSQAPIGYHLVYRAKAG